MQNNYIDFSRNQDFFCIREDIEQQRGKYLLEIEVFKQKNIDEHIFFYVEQKLYEFLFEMKQSIFLGKIIQVNKYKYFFLINDKTDINEAVNYAMNEFQELSYGVFVKKFSKKNIQKFIPNEQEIQESKNLEILSEIDEKILGTKQKVVFFISYKKTDIFTFFQQSVEKFGFIVENI